MWSQKQPRRLEYSCDGEIFHLGRVLDVLDVLIELLAGFCCQVFHSLNVNSEMIQNYIGPRDSAFHDQVGNRAASMRRANSGQRHDSAGRAELGDSEPRIQSSHAVSNNMDA